MFKKFRPITISLSPNTEKDDIFLAAKLIFQPVKWKIEKAATEELEEKFKKYLGIRHAFSFNSGRSSLLAILAALKIEKGDEVLVQGFTCNSAVNPILAREAKPVFVDIDDTMNLSPQDLERKITSHSRAVMIQHTFGCPAQIEEILRIAKDHDLLVIEDCAHSLGAKYRGKFCGTFGDVAFFSFGRDKIISSVYGGMAVTNNPDLAERMADFRKEISDPSSFWIWQQLMHPILMNYFVLPFYNFLNLGKIFLIVFHWLHLLSKAVYKKEKTGEIPSYFPKKMPNALAILALNQFEKLERFNRHRRRIAQFYQQELKTVFKNKGMIFMRYPVLVADPGKILTEARNRGIILNDGWREKTIVPPDTNQEIMEYIPGSCPQAEKTAKSIVNLPTHINISLSDADRITRFLLGQ